jgi:glycosyltransferase involved in cell wall biosynthesis
MVSNLSTAIQPTLLAMKAARRINVLSVIHYGTFGGPHNHNLHLIPRLAELNVHTTVLLPAEPGNALERFRRAGIDAVAIPLHRLRGGWRPGVHAGLVLNWRREVRSIRRLIREREIDVVQINGLMHPHGAFAARAEGAAVVWQIIEGTVPMALRRLMMPIIKAKANVLMTTGMQIAREHPGATEMGERLIPFFPALNVELFRPNQATRIASRAELGLKADDQVVGTVGNLYPIKDHLTFIRAAAILHARYPNTRFVMLGATYSNFANYTDSLWREAKRIGFTLGRELIHRDAQARVAELAQAFDVFWLTSKAEGAPNCIEEALALELPVVATNVGSVREMIENGANGYVVPPSDPAAIADATVKLFAQPELRIKMGKRGRAIAVGQFNADICAELHQRAFEMAIAHNRARLGELISN